MRGRKLVIAVGVVVVVIGTCVELLVAMIAYDGVRQDVALDLRAGGSSPSEVTSIAVDALVRDDRQTWASIAGGSPRDMARDVTSGRVTKWYGQEPLVELTYRAHRRSSETTGSALVLLSIQRNLRGRWVLTGWHETP